MRFEEVGRRDHASIDWARVSADESSPELQRAALNAAIRQRMSGMSPHDVGRNLVFSVPTDC